MFEPWWRTSVDRLKWEYEWLQAKGLRFEELSRNEESGDLTLRVMFPLESGELDLTVVFPATYPDTRPEISTKNLELKRHQQPYSGGLCLIGRSSEQWDPNQSLASFLEERIPLMITAATTDDLQLAANLEENQADPALTFIPFDPFSAILLATGTSKAKGKSGTFESKVSLSRRGDCNVIRGLITHIDASAIYNLKLPPEDLGFPTSLLGTWVRLAMYKPGCSAEELFDVAVEQHPTLRNQKSTVVVGLETQDLIAVIAPDEYGYKKLGENWIFILRSHRKAQNRKTKPRTTYSFIRSFRYSVEELEQRAPELHGLSHKKVALIGLGCLGAPIALELAKAGVGHLRLMDADLVEGGTTIRWPLGFPAIGEPKSFVLSSYLHANNPLVSVTGLLGRIGAPGSVGGVNVRQLQQFFEGVDLVIDATAETGISSLLAHQMSRAGKPLIVASGTAGGWGGMVLTTIPEQTGCFDCWLRYVDDGTLPLPNASPKKLVTIPGCANPTFTAAHFDIEEISLATVRMAVSTLLGGRSGAYPITEPGYDFVNLRKLDGKFTLPQWSHRALPLHPHCPHHNSGSVT